ncbi:MAG: hypothetical protein WDM90_05130 [Ferruginibacter sp.]
MKLNTPLIRNKIYTITATGVTDCAGNNITANNTARVGLAKLQIVLILLSRNFIQP